ncbi:hypothetical protein RRG08_050633 [Elysia crispata]|uniref:Uncharacterized protein n=1 Tax=Elysia crispata TaxID=231223 RepID=A0AAE1DA64_9GAST|nr:hypothetical protein RRG08_050633 [Elysia crispata]
MSKDKYEVVFGFTRQNTQVDLFSYYQDDHMTPLRHKDFYKQNVLCLNLAIWVSLLYWFLCKGTLSLVCRRLRRAEKRISNALTRQTECPEGCEERRNGLAMP